MNRHCQVLTFPCILNQIIFFFNIIYVILLLIYSCIHLVPFHLQGDLLCLFWNEEVYNYNWKKRVCRTSQLFKYIDFHNRVPQFLYFTNFKNQLILSKPKTLGNPLNYAFNWINTRTACFIKRVPQLWDSYFVSSTKH